MLHCDSFAHAGMKQSGCALLPYLKAQQQRKRRMTGWLPGMHAHKLLFPRVREVANLCINSK